MKQRTAFGMANLLHDNDPQLPKGMDVGEVLPWLGGDGWRRTARDSMNRLLGIPQVFSIFKRNSQRDDENTFLGILEERKMTLAGGMLRDELPKTGATIVIANHPFGGADAISLGAVCADLRKDVLMMANEMTSELPGMDRWLVPVSIMGAEDAARANLESMKRCLRHLRDGGMLIVFPAGAVSRWRNDLGRIADPEWTSHVTRLALKTNTPVVPVKFMGKAPLWFHLLGAIHPMVRSALILRVFLTAKGSAVGYRAGEAIDAPTLKQCSSDAEATSLLREAVESIEPLEV